MKEVSPKARLSRQSTAIAFIVGVALVGLVAAERARAQESPAGEHAIASSDPHPSDRGMVSPSVTPDSGQVAPDEPVVLRFRFEHPLTYVVTGSSRMAVKGRDDLRQLYRTSMELTYRPVDDGSLPPLAYKLNAVDPGEEQEQAADDERRILVEVRRVRAGFEEPPGLREGERTHRLLQHATFSYRLRPDGRLEDLQVHGATDPMARGSLEQMRHLAQSMQPVFPGEPVVPGATWTQEISYRDGEGLAQYSQDGVNRYEFKEWRPCRDAICAYITITQEMNAAGRMRWRQTETQGSTRGGGEGWLLFDPARGEIVRSQWTMRSQGWTRAKSRREDGSVGQDVDAEVLVEVQTTVDRVDPARAPVPKLPSSASGGGAPAP